MWPQRLLTHVLPVYSSSSLSQLSAPYDKEWRKKKPKNEESVISLRFLQTKSPKTGTSKRGGLRRLFSPNSGNTCNNEEILSAGQEETRPVQVTHGENGLTKSESRALIDSLTVVIDSHSWELGVTLRARAWHCNNTVTLFIFPQSTSGKRNEETEQRTLALKNAV